MLLRLTPGSVIREVGLIQFVLKTARVQLEITNNNPSANFKLPKKTPPRFRRISDIENDRTLSVLFYNEDRPYK